MPEDHIYREVIKSGTVMELSKALSTCGITDENPFYVVVFWSSQRLGFVFLR